MYEPQNFDNLLGLTGFSDNALNTHFKLYQGYVTNTNKVADKLNTLDKSSSEYAELKRRFGWEFNGMRLHEYHFGAMTKDFTPLGENSELYKKIANDFGSYEAWETDFKATAAMRGIGWAILYWDERTNRLFNVFVNEHDVGHLGGAKLLLNLDVFEHAYLIDHNTNRGEYINAFIKTIDWEVIENRFQ
jgi:Fe-Mn family superoxide dismutase